MLLLRSSLTTTPLPLLPPLLLLPVLLLLLIQPVCVSACTNTEAVAVLSEQDMSAVTNSALKWTDECNFKACCKLDITVVGFEHLILL